MKLNITSYCRRTITYNATIRHLTKRDEQVKNGIGFEHSVSRWSVEIIISKAREIPVF